MGESTKFYPAVKRNRANISVRPNSGALQPVRSRGEEVEEETGVVGEYPLEAPSAKRVKFEEQQEEDDWFRTDKENQEDDEWFRKIAQSNDDLIGGEEVECPDDKWDSEAVEEGEEAPKVRRRVAGVVRPSKEEIEDHESTHAQYRSWCPSCVRARGVANHHQKSDADVEREVPEIVFDYCFPSSKMTVLVIKDVKSGAIRSLIIPVKGIAEHHTMKEVVDTIDNLWGSSRIIMKTDTEGPIQALKMFVKDVRNGETILEDVVKGDSASNGKAEKAVRDVQGMIRTWKDAVETSYSIQLGPNHILIPWIVRHSGEAITRCRMDSTG